MAERALPQASRKNVLRVFRELLRPGEQESYSTGQLAESGYGQARHVHALLTFLGFLDGDQPTHDVRKRRRQSQDMAAWLRRATCESYKRLGNVGFLFDEPNQETARSQAKERVEAFSRQAARPLMKRNISQVVDCLLSLRDVHGKLRDGRRDWLDPPPEQETREGETPPAAAKPSPEPKRTVGPADDAANSNGSQDRASGVTTDNPIGEQDLVSRLTAGLSNTSRRITLHAKHVEINDAGRTTFQLADVDVTIE